MGDNHWERGPDMQAAAQQFADEVGGSIARAMAAGLAETDLREMMVLIGIRDTFRADNDLSVAQPMAYERFIEAMARISYDRGRYDESAGRGVRWTTMGVEFEWLP